MKAFCTLFTALFLLVGVADQAEAKRFGSGGGFGKKATPTQQRQAAPAQKQESTQQNNAAPAQQAAGKSGLMGGMIGGLLAGGIFAYLLGSGAFEGIQFMDILLIVLVIGVLFFVLKKRSAPARASYAGQAPQQRQTFDMGNIGGGQTPNAAMSAPVQSEPIQTAPSIDLPAGFDQAAFVQGSLEHYRTVQNAWNHGDLSLISDYVKPTLYAELAIQRQAMGIAPATEILDLDAVIVAAGRNGDKAEISLLFKGRVRDLVEGSEDGIFDVWHLERDLSKENSPWLIAGIEAE